MKKKILSCLLSASMVMSLGAFSVEAATTTNSYICNIDFSGASGSRTSTANSLSGLGRMSLYGVADNTTSIETEGENKYVKFAYTGSDTGAKGVGAFILNQDEVVTGNYAIEFDYNNVSALSNFDIQGYYFEHQQYGYVPLTIKADGTVNFAGSNYTDTGITKGEWHNIKINVNTDTQVATLSVDGAKVAEKAWTAGGMMYTTDYHAQKCTLNFRTSRAAAGSDESDIYFDNLKVYTISSATDYSLVSKIISENFDSRTNSDSYLDMTGSGFYGINKATAGNEVMSIYADTYKTSNVLEYLGGTSDFTWYSNANVSLGDAQYVNLELSFKMGSKADLLKWVYKDTAGNFVTPIEICNNNIKVFGKTISSTYATDKWYHIVVCTTVGETGYLVYLNNENVASGSTSNAMSDTLVSNRLQFRASSQTSAVMIDDLKVLSMSACGYDPEYEGSLCTLTSETYDINETTKTISLPVGTTLATFKSNVEIPTGASIVLSEGSLADGTKLTVVSSSGVLVNTYTVNMSSTTSDVYTIDGSAKTISGVPYYTTVADFLSNITSSEELSVQTTDASVVTTGYIENGMKLIAGSKDYAINLIAPIIDADFEGASASASDIGRTVGLASSGVVAEDDVKGKALKYDLTDDNWAGFQYYRDAFNITGSYNFEWSFKAEDLNTGFKFIGKEGSDAKTGFIPSFEVCEGVMKYSDPTLPEEEQSITIATYDANKWYHVVYSSKMVNNKIALLSIYVNGDCILRDKEIDQIEDDATCPTYMGYCRFEVRNKTGKAAKVWLDDVKLYQTASPLYDATYEGATAEVTSDTLSIDNGIIYLDQASYTQEELSELLSFTCDPDSIKIYNADGTEAEGDVTAGMTMTIMSDSHEIIKYYTFADKSSVTVKNIVGGAVVSIVNGTYTVSADSSVISDGDKVFVGTYNDSQLVGLSIFDASGSVTIDDTVNTLKVFVVNPATLAPSIAATILSK